MSTALQPGDKVEVFFRHGHDKHGSFPVSDAFSAQLRPRISFSDGWVPARVLKDLPAEGCVHVCHTHLLWSNRKGELLTEKELAASEAAAGAAAAASDFNSGSAAAKLASAAHCDGKFNRCDVRIATESPPVPFLSAVVVRWGGATTEFAEQWGAISSSVSDKYIDAFLDTAYSCLGPRYEVLSVFVESGADLSRLQLGSLAGRLRGNHRCACYFLWPTLAQVIR
jgi:hypothetical protein